MKGGLRLSINYVTIHHKRIDLDEGRCVTLHYITIHHKRIDLDEGRCKMHCNGCMNVAWGSCWGGSRSTKPWIFPCKVAAGGDERYLLCAAGAAAVGLPFFLRRIVTVASICFGCACACVVVGCLGICGCRSHWNGCMIVVVWCCHVRRYVQVCNVMLRNAL